MESKNYIEEIRKACIKANPEIVKLKFGCRVSFERGHGKELGTYLGETSLFKIIYPDDYSYGIYQITNGRFNHIGRPITLADVLLVVAIKYKEKYPNSIGKFDDEVLCALLEMYNLKETMENQDEPTLKFIYELIK